MLIQTSARKYRDELRPRQGLLRTKEFMMKDLYTFDISEKAALDTYQSVRAAYRSFFEALGVPYVEVEASSGNMGGSLSHEYHFLSPLGEDTIVICESCGFAANEEILEKKAENQDHHQCPRCTGNRVSSHRAIEVGHTFHLGTRYTEPLNAFVTVPKMAQLNEKTAEQAEDQARNITTQDGSTGRVPLQMGCHGIGVSRLVGAVAAMTADEKGLSWPPLMAPAHVVIVFDGATPPINPKHPEKSNDYAYMTSRLGSITYKGDWGHLRGVDIVFDDRDKPLPWKLKDADLIGYPIIVVIGKSFKETGQYEVQCRSSSELSVTSEHLTVSVGIMLNKLTPKTRPKMNWRLGNPTTPMTSTEIGIWAHEYPSEKGKPTTELKNKRAVTKGGKDRSTGAISGSSPLLEQNMDNKQQPNVIPSSNTRPVIRRAHARCPDCGKHRKIQLHHYTFSLYIDHL
jgi:prolyl-tRNA synthetase